MDTRNTVEITINGRRYKLSGNESPAYMQKVAEYINNMYGKLKEIPGFTGRSHDYQTMMMYLNLADEYLKKSGWTEEKQAAADTKAAEDIYRLKLELVEARKQAEAAEASRSEETLALKKQLEVTQEERNRLAAKDKESLSRISGLEKEADSYKTEISILKRKVSDYVKSASQVEKQLKDAAAREREEKLLRNKYETQLSKQKAEYESRLAQLKNQLESAGADQAAQIEKQNEKLTAVRKQLSICQAENESRTAEGQKQIAALKAGYEVKLEAFQKQMEKQAEDYENQLAEMRAEYENRISSMKPGYENLLTEQESEYETRLDNMKKEYEEQLDSMKKEYEEQLDTMKQEHEAQNKEETAAQLEQVRQQAAREKAELFQENGELMKEKRKLQQQIQELTGKVRDSENDMIEYLDLIDEKDKEIASLKFRLQEEHYE